MRPRFSLLEAGRRGVGTMGPGSCEVTAFAYDDAGEDLVRYRDGGDYGRMNWQRSQQRVTWKVTVP